TADPHHTPTPLVYPLSLHDALPIWSYAAQANDRATQQMGRDRAPASRGDGRLRAGVQNTVAVRTDDDSLVALDLVGQLRRDAHVAPLTRPTPHFHDGEPPSPHENRLVLAPQLRVYGGRQLVAPLSRLVESRRQRRHLRADPRLLLRAPHLARL